MVSFGIIGIGWRAEFYLRIALACPDRFRVTGFVGRNPERVEAFARKFGIAHFGTVESLVSESKPQFVVTSVSWDSNPDVIKQLVELGVPVLSETPPATSTAEMDELCSLAANGAKIQVAEQYFLQPHHAARLAFVRGGKLGRISQAQISAAHGYHGISLIRRFLDVQFEDVKITAKSFKSPILKIGERGSVVENEEIVESEQTIAYLDFGDRLGIYDFTGDQYFGETRNTRILLRGERGELVTDTVAYMKDGATPIHASFLRHATGQHGNLDGLYLKGIQIGEEWAYRNPVAPGRLSDDEIAIADCLLKMAAYVEGGPELYSLAEACQDRYLDILIHDSLEKNEEVASSPQSWAEGSNR